MMPDMTQQGQAQTGVAPMSAPVPVVYFNGVSKSYGRITLWQHPQGWRCAGILGMNGAANRPCSNS